jgi:hypothetical protein
MKTAILATIILAALLARPAISADQFKDVPKDHWAAESVQIVKADGVMQGYPDATFKGNKAVTRYELAAALERMIAFIEQGLKPELKSPESKVESPKPQVQSQDPAQALKAGGFIPANSPLLTNRDKTVSPAELTQALSSVAAKLIEKTIPPPNE